MQFGVFTVGDDALTHAPLGVHTGAAGRARWPLHGRDAELDTLEETLRRTTSTGTGRRLVVTGAPGLGRTALLQELSGRASRSGVAVAAVATQPLGHVPLEPVLLGLSTGRAPVLSAEAARAVAALAHHRLLQVRLLERLLRRHAARRTLLVSVDDVHRLDPDSLWSLRHLSELLDDSPVAWVLSAPSRSPDLAVAGIVHTHGRRLHLGPLDAGAVLRLATDRLGHPPDRSTRATLAAALGNPSRACELIAARPTTPLPEPRNAARPRFGWEALTDAELTVARLVAEGHSNRSLAALLYVSPNTVSTHLRSVFSKLDVHSRVQLTRMVLEQTHDAHAAGSADREAER